MEKPPPVPAGRFSVAGADAVAGARGGRRVAFPRPAAWEGRERNRRGFAHRSLGRLDGRRVVAEMTDELGPSVGLDHVLVDLLRQLALRENGNARPNVGSLGTSPALSQPHRRRRISR